MELKHTHTSTHYQYEQLIIALNRTSTTETCATETSTTPTDLLTPSVTPPATPPALSPANTCSPCQPCMESPQQDSLATDKQPGVCNDK